MSKDINPVELDFLLRFPSTPNVTSPVDFMNNWSWGGIKVSKGVLALGKKRIFVGHWQKISMPAVTPHLILGYSLCFGRILLKYEIKLLRLMMKVTHANKIDSKVQ